MLEMTAPFRHSEYPIYRVEESFLMLDERKSIRFLILKRMNCKDKQRVLCYCKTNTVAFVR